MYNKISGVEKFITVDVKLLAEYAMHNLFPLKLTLNPNPKVKCNAF